MEPPFMTSNFQTFLKYILYGPAHLGLDFLLLHPILFGCCIWGLRKANPAEVPKLDFAISPLCSTLKLYSGGRREEGGCDVLPLISLATYIMNLSDILWRSFSPGEAVVTNGGRSPCLGGQRDDAT